MANKAANEKERVAGVVPGIYICMVWYGVIFFFMFVIVVMVYCSRGHPPHVVSAFTCCIMAFLFSRLLARARFDPFPARRHTFLDRDKLVLNRSANPGVLSRRPIPEGCGARSHPNSHNDEERPVSCCLVVAVVSRISPSSFLTRSEHHGSVIFFHQVVSQ